jgi:hypothetical protein
MAIKEADWIHRTREIETKQRPINEGLLKQAVVNAKLLTGHPGWDSYLSRLQVQVDYAQGELQTMYERLGTVMNDDTLRATYTAINVFRMRLETLHFCMSLPTEIVDHAADTLDK